MQEYPQKGLFDLIIQRLSTVFMIMPAIIVFIIVIEVVMRYLFGRPTLWVNELSLWIGGGIYLLSGLYAHQQRGHIRIFILYDIVPRWLQKTFDVLSVLMLIVFVSAAIWGGFNDAYTKLVTWERFGTAWDPPIPATNKPLILVTLLLLVLQSISNLITDWNNRPLSGNPDDDTKIPDTGKEYV